jgi:penicillin-binding protein 1A
LKIHTTFNLKLQALAEKAVAHQISVLEEQMKKNHVPVATLQAALVAMDVKTGGICAMIGGKDPGDTRFNRVVQARRPPGSAFAPLVFATAISLGYSQNQTLIDAPLKTCPGRDKTWHAKNFSPYEGEITLRKALARSRTIPVVRLLTAVTPEAEIAYARKSGITSRISPTEALAFGTFKINLLELTAAYIPFANRGILPRVSAITRIIGPDGRLIYKQAIHKKSVLSRKSAAVMADMLRAVILEGTGRQARCIKKETAGKTGTTHPYTDAYFIGFSPDLVIGVWVGKDDGSPLGPGENGANAALPIWIACMQGFLADHSFPYFDIPDGTHRVYIHPDSGEILSPANPSAVRALLCIRGGH